MHSFAGGQDRHQDEVSRHEARRRLGERLGGIHVENFVFGANDGVITTFAIVAGATGGNVAPGAIIILGFANLFADGLSMGASNYLAKRSKTDYINTQRQMEEWEIEHLPEQELEEVRRIFTQMGLEGEQLETVVQAVTQDKSTWVDVMMTRELGLAEDSGSPVVHGLATWAAFIIAGFVPLLPYLYCSGPRCFIISSMAAAVTLFTAGALRTLITRINWLRGGLEMLGIGSAAAVVAYGVGKIIAALV